MFTFKIINIDPTYVQVDNTHILDVEVEIYKGEELFETKKFGFPLDATKEVILAELEKVCATLASDEGVAEQSRALEEGLANAAALKNELVTVDESQP